MTIPYAIQKPFPEDPLFTILEHTEEHVFITGRAGTGKSTLLQDFLKYTSKNVVVLAPTGLAAITVGGQTIHSFFKLPPHIVTEDEIYKKRFPNDIYRDVDTIVIDEISMVRVDIFDAIEGILRLYGDKKKPFGGKQVILFGDLFQLPPVLEKDSAESLQNLGYKTPYFFSAKSFPKDMLVLELTKVYRQVDPEFIGFLDLVRTGSFSEKELSYVNARVLPHDDKAIILTTRNHLVQEYNKKRLAQLIGPVQVFDAIIEGEFPEKYAPADKRLLLKSGARVIFLKNDPDGQWVNGTLGTIKSITSTIQVETDDGFLVSVSKEHWKNVQYTLEDGSIKKVERGHFDQYPLRLAWALTIHKSQGQTFDGVYLDLTSAPWEHGHVYVALSRCRSFSGLRLKQKLLMRDVIVDQRIINFFDSLKVKTSDNSATIFTRDIIAVESAYAEFAKLLPLEITYQKNKCILIGSFRKAFYVFLKQKLAHTLTDIRYSENI
jgi:ATP-dependent DNA helicase PIF1